MYFTSAFCPKLQNIISKALLRQTDESMAIITRKLVFYIQIVASSVKKIADLGRKCIKRVKMRIERHSRKSPRSRSNAWRALTTQRARGSHTRHSSAFLRRRQVAVSFGERAY